MMMMKHPKILKAAAALIVLSCLSIYHRVPFSIQMYYARVQMPGLSIETGPGTTRHDIELSKNITIDDIFISVKTSIWYQDTRLPIILKTWYQLAKQQIWFFTDMNNHHLEKEIIDGHIVYTNCSTTHSLTSLCCKMSAEYDHYLKNLKKWFCHFDDDNYVNVPRLVSVLQKYNHQEDWYLGKNSIYKPIQLNKNIAHSLARIYNQQYRKIYTFMFATGGAGFCISRSLAFKMQPLASGGRLISICNHLRKSDDVTIGFVIEKLLQKNLTIVPEFHSHLEQLKLLSIKNLKDQISFSYSFRRKKGKDNIFRKVINVPGFNFKYDPSRFLSLHCFLFPKTEFCPDNRMML